MYPELPLDVGMLYAEQRQASSNVQPHTTATYDLYAGQSSYAPLRGVQSAITRTLNPAKPVHPELPLDVGMLYAEQRQTSSNVQPHTTATYDLYAGQSSYAPLRGVQSAITR